MIAVGCCQPAAVGTPGGDPLWLFKNPTRTLQCTTVREKSKMLAPKNHKNPQDAPKTLPGYPQDALRRPKKAQDAKMLISLVLEAFLND